MFHPPLLEDDSCKLWLNPGSTGHLEGQWGGELEVDAKSSNKLNNRTINHDGNDGFMFHLRIITTNNFAIIFHLRYFVFFLSLLKPIITLIINKVIETLFLPIIWIFLIYFGSLGTT